MRTHNLIPVSEPLLGKEEETNLIECISTGWISSEGPFVKKFEKICARYCQVQEGIAVSSGTAALQVALRALSLKKGDEVIMPSFTIISCAIAIIEAGATPVLVDCESETWTMDVEQVKKKITARTKAIMAVHIYGHSVDMDPLLSLAKEHNLYVIEDAAEAHGAEYKGRKCGSLSDISILSFYANKLITTGEGGMVLTNNQEFAAKARLLRNMYFIPEKRFYHTDIGHNYRMTNLQAAVGVAQMKQIDEFVERKRRMARLYNELLCDLPIQLPNEKQWAKNVYWMYGIVLNNEVSLDTYQCMQKLLEKGIETRSFFIGMHEQPIFHKSGFFQNESYPVSERISRRGFYLPSGQAITDQQITYIAKELCSILS